MNKLTTRRIATAAVVGALYTVLTVFGSVFGITFGPIQCRFSEALCVLPHRLAMVNESHLDSTVFLGNLLDEIPVPLETL